MSNPGSGSASAKSSQPSDTVEEQTFTISELAKAFGLTARAIRFYEDKKLLSPRRNGQARIYSKRDRARLIIIQRAKGLGLSLTDIREILDLYEAGDDQVSQGRVATLKIRERIEVLERQREDIEVTLFELREIAQVIEKELAGKAAELNESDEPGLIGYAVAPDGA